MERLCYKTERQIRPIQGLEHHQGHRRQRQASSRRSGDGSKRSANNIKPEKKQTNSQKCTKKTNSQKCTKKFRKYGIKNSLWQTVLTMGSMIIPGPSVVEKEP
ncbi:hypothetical protein ElyMa_000023100 [Elysia marginata]|uniref:Uncharacterized protein n=1 Tax=Elysia marginata TaxID=1093978 RepID=A0AAV4EBK0_9GAST|nr:hypothetical protein ElyMa_000023100 [Elysia marginata]